MVFKRLKRMLGGTICLALMLAVVPATAATYTAESGNLAASVDFTVNGNNQLVVTLINTSTADALRNTDLLGAVFFNLNGVPGALDGASAALYGGSSVYVGPTLQDGNDIAGEWGYSSSVSAGGLSGFGISSVGYDGISWTRFSDTTPWDPINGGKPLDGGAFSLTSAGDDLSTGNGRLGSDARVGVIQNGVVLTFDGNWSGFNPYTDVTDIYFQYGTDLSEPRTNVPDGGSTMALLGTALIGAGVFRRKIIG